MGTRDDQEQVLLTVEEAVEFLKVSRATVYRLIERGVLEKVKEKGKRGWKITLDSLEVYQTANSFTLQELASRLIAMERKLNFLLTRGNSQQDKVAPMKIEFGELQREIAKRHPEWLKH